MPADNGNDDVRIFLDVFPGAVAVGLVADFKNHVRDICIFLRHLVKERNRLGQILVGVVVRKDMPVHHHVHVACNRVLHAPAQNFEVLFAVAVHVVVGIHRKPYQVRIPFRAQLVEKLLVHVLRVPREAMRTRPPEHHEFAVLIVEFRAHHMQLAARRGACDRVPRKRKRRKRQEQGEEGKKGF